MTRTPWDRIELAEEVVQTGQLPLAQRLGLLRACLATTDTMVRQWSVYALAGHPSPKVTVILRELLDDRDEEVQALALKGLASRKDSGVFDVCTRWLCHGTPRLRGAARTAAMLLQDDRATELLEIIWQSADLSVEERIVVGNTLLRRGNEIGVHFLEEQLAHPQVCYRAFIAPDLARLGNPRALQEMTRLARRTLPRWRDSIRFLFWRTTQIPIKAPDDKWTAAVLAWVEQHRLPTIAQ